MYYALLAIVIVFGAAVGAQLANNGGNLLGLIALTLAAVTAMQFAFVVTALILLVD